MVETVEEEMKEEKRGKWSSSKYRTWKRRQQRKAQRRRAAEARVGPSLSGRPSGLMPGAATNAQHFSGGGRGRGFVARVNVLPVGRGRGRRGSIPNDSFSVAPIGRGRGVHPELVVGSGMGPSRLSVPSLEADTAVSRVPAPSVSSEEADPFPGEMAPLEDANATQVKREPSISASALEPVPEAEVEVTPDVSVSVPGPFPETEFLPCYDAHFHPDRLSAKTANYRAGEPLVPGRMPDRLILLAGGVMNLCDPQEFLSPQFEMNLDKDPKYKMAVGIHPKKAHKFSNRQWQAFRRLLNHPRVVGISKVGLDFTVDSIHWRAQEDLLNNILSLGTSGFVLVMHLRCAQVDPLGGVVYRLGHRLLRRHCSRHQRIHLHCSQVTRKR